jgi:hypothetical protein
MMPRKFLALTIGVAALFAVIATAQADHSWNGYRWPDSKLSPMVFNKTTSTMFDVPAAVQEWRDLGTPIQPIMGGTAKTANITVTEAFSTQWLGLAQVWVNGDGFITRGQVKLNKKLLAGYPKPAADHVLCQEFGHILGLDHNRAGDSSPGDDTCMNDQVNLQNIQYTTPNEHDEDQLNAVYGSSAAAPPAFSSFAGSTQTGGSGGHWVTVHVTWAK